MRKSLKSLARAFILLLALTAPAHADPISLGVAGTFLVNALINVAIAVVATVAGAAISGLFGPKPEERKTPGRQLQMRLGGDGPLTFPLGPAATAGSLVYPGSYGKVDGTKNAYLVQVITISDLPISGYSGFWINDERVTLGETATERGYPVNQYRRGGRDHMWISAFDGTEGAINSFLQNKFGSHDTYPWQSDMIGRGVAYIVVTTLLPGPDDQDLISGAPKVLVEPGSIPLYDIRKDTTAGGDGTHRWEDPSTWEPSSNRMVQAYNVARGIYYYPTPNSRAGAEWVYGGQNWPAFRLPASSWMAAMNACDLAIGLDGGGTEPQFHGGGMVECDNEPATTIEELLKSSLGLITEVGGIYKVRVGAPGVPVMSFTDADIIVTREQGYRPFVGLEETYNTVNATYSEPEQRWASKEAPQLRDIGLIAEDDNRELPLGMDFPWVQSNTTVQRIIQAALQNSRRVATHAQYLPPQAWLLEPLDVVEWSSERNGYEAKEFDLEEITGASDFLQFIRIRESDPGDFDWTPATDEQAYSVAAMATIRPTPQAMTGWAVAPSEFYDEEGRARRPAIEIEWASGLDNVAQVRVQVREGWGDKNLVFEGLESYDPPPRRLSSFAGMAPNTTYEVRGRFVLNNDAVRTLWSNQEYVEGEVVEGAWLTVTTPNIKLSSADIDISGALGAVGELLEWLGPGMRNALRNLEQLGTLLYEQDLANYEDKSLLLRELASRTGEIEAGYTEAIEVATGAASAIAQKLETLFAAFGGDTASVNMRWVATATAAGYAASYGVEAAADADEVYRSAAFGVDVPIDPLDPTRFWVKADQFIVTDGTVDTHPLVFQGGVLKLNVARAGRITSADGTSMIVDFDDPEIYMEG